MKMRALVILIAVFCFTATLGHELTEAQIEFVLQLKDACVASTGVSHDMVINTKNGDWPEDPLLKEFMFCMMKSFTFMNDAGEIVADNMKEVMEAELGPEVTSHLMEDCAISKGNGPDTAFFMAKCLLMKYHKNF